MLPCLDTRKLVAMMETASNASDRAFDIKEVFDVETNKPGIVAGSPFYVFGQSFSDDMTATLVDAEGAEHTCTNPVRDRIPTRLTFTAPSDIPAGKYTLAISGVGCGEVVVTQKKPNVPVKSEWTPPVPPTVDSIATEGKEGIVKGEAFAAIGANLSWHEGDSVTVKWTEDGEEKSLEIEPTATTPTKMDFDAVDAFDDIPDDTELTFEFELSGETAEGETRIVVA